MRVSHLVGAAAAVLLASFATANAQQTVNVGRLLCHGGPNVGHIVSSKTELECVFQSNRRGPDHYIATITRIGVDLGMTKTTTLGWTVGAPTTQIGPGDLAGHYGGVGGNASVGVGGGSNFLVGGSANSFTLQPLSLQGQTGVNVAGGFVGLDLEPVVWRQHRHHRRHR